MTDRVRVVLADDHAVVRDAIAHEVTARGGYEVVAQCDDGEQALSAIRLKKPRLAVLDVSMPHLGGLSVARYVRLEELSCDIVLLTMHADERLVDRAKAEGVKALVRKDDALEELHAAMTAVLNGGTHWPSFGAPKHGAGPLTPRETEVLTLVAQGLSGKQIGVALNISPRTVEVHRFRVMKKIGASSIADLIRFAIRSGLLDL